MRGPRYPSVATMPPVLPEVPAPVQVGLQLVLIALAAVAGYLVVRFAVRLMVRHLLDARNREIDTGRSPRPSSSGG